LQVHISLDENLVKWQGRLRLQPHFIALWTQDAAAAFSGFALTHGWQDLFTELYTDPEMSGWQAQSDKENWRIQEQQLFYIGSENVASIITKSALPEDYELVVNVRLVQETYAEQAYGFLPVLDGNQSGTLLTVARNGAGWTLKCDDATAPQQFSLAPDFDPFHYQQFRFRKQGSALTIRHEAQFLGQIKVPQIATQIGLYASGNTVTFDMVRVTAIKE
jgi:hypothetical protein